jgi:hypothetical protein
MKKCSICLNEKTIEEFPKRSAKCNVCFAEHRRKWREDNKDKVTEHCKKYQKKLRQKNKQEKEKEKKTVKKCKKCENEKPIKEFPKNSAKCNVCFAEHKSNWRKENKNKIAKSKAISYQKNKKKIYKKNNERMKNDISYKLKKICRTRIYNIIHKKHPTNIYIGCKTDFLLDWFVFCFKDKDKNNMSFENHGKIWHIDHVIPLDTFDLENEDQQMTAFNWKNLSPELAKFNLQKGNKIDTTQIKNHIQKITDFHKSKNMDIPHKYIEILEQKCKMPHNDSGNPLEP